MSNRKEILAVSDEIESLMREIRTKKNKTNEWKEEEIKKVDELENEVGKLYPSGHPKTVFIVADVEGHPFKWLQWCAENGSLLSGSDFFQHPFVGLTLDEALELLKKVLDRAREILVPTKASVTVTVDGYDFTINSDWNYRVEVESPAPPLTGPAFSQKFGNRYVIKHRVIMFVQAMKLAPSNFAGWGGYVNLSSNEINTVIRTENREWKRWRTRRYDPNNQISVSGGGRDWTANFSRFGDVFDVGSELSKQKLVEIANTAREYGYEVKETGVS